MSLTTTSQQPDNTTFDADVAIIGGGIMGSALAYWLTRLEPLCAVTVIERDPSYATASSALSANANDKLLIEGNCDERGTEEYNRALGERRALAAREALAKRGVSPERIRTISYGKDKPTDPGHDDAAWSKNRRADFVLLHPKP